MSKKVFNWMLMAALVVGLGMNVTSCKDDDDDKDGRSAEEIAQDPYEKESEAADALYRLVSQLSVCDSLPNDWKTATFEPKAGKVLDASQPRVRTIAVNNAAEAVARYNSLTGKDLPATTTSDTYKVDGVGTLTLNVGGAGTIATIDVDVKQMPQLAQLRLVSVSDIGENGHFKGDPYYRFGDVVKDRDGCYWICVRPAYSPNGKEDTHWMSFQVTDKNIKTYTKKGCQEQKYPVDLGVQKEKMQYLAQLMAIMANPYKYQEAAGPMGKYFGTTGLGGLDPEAMPVDSLVKQANLWDQNKIWEKIMSTGYNDDEATQFKSFFKNNVRFIYEKGSTSGTNLTIKTVQYTGAPTFYRNEPTYDKVTVDMKTLAFDVTKNFSTLGTSDNDDWPVLDAFVVRYKTGFQLSSNWVFNPSPTDSIPGVTTVHRFNAYQGTQVTGKDEYTAEQAEPRMILAANGKFYKDDYACEAHATKPVALVVYVGDSVEVNGNIAYHGLAMSYDKVASKEWEGKRDKKSECIENTSKNSRVWETQNNGVERTQKLYEDGHDHPAAKAAWQFTVAGFKPTEYGFSRWFLPTAGQVMKAVRGLGGTVEYDEKDDYWKCTLNEELNYELTSAGVEDFSLVFNCWTSTELDKTKAVYFESNGQVRIDEDGKVDVFLDSDYKNKMHDVRLFIAF